MLAAEEGACFPGRDRQCGFRNARTPGPAHRALEAPENEGLTVVNHFRRLVEVVPTGESGHAVAAFEEGEIGPDLSPAACGIGLKGSCRSAVQSTRISKAGAFRVRGRPALVGVSRGAAERALFLARGQTSEGAETSGIAPAILPVDCQRYESAEVAERDDVNRSKKARELSGPRLGSTGWSLSIPSHPYRRPALLELRAPSSVFRRPWPRW